MRVRGTVAVSLVLAAASVALRARDARAYGESSGGFPNWAERVVHEWMNRARVEPALEMTRCGANCGEAACYSAQPPLVYGANLNHASRFHSDEMRLQGYFAHDSMCTLVAGIAGAYPATCDGAAACACVGGARACSPTCTSWSARVALFGTGPSAEIIASPTDPDSAFYLWLFERSTATTCAYSGSNGHRWSILTSSGQVGVGVSGPAVGDFAGGGGTQRIPSGSHYPRQAASVDVWVNWVDAAAPRRAVVNVDGACTDLRRARGTDTNGAWTAALTSVATGCHRYYFTFVDSAGALVSYPGAGSLGIGPAASCADWDATRPAMGATCPMPGSTGSDAGAGTDASSPDVVAVDVVAMDVVTADVAARDVLTGVDRVVPSDVATRDVSVAMDSAALMDVTTARDVQQGTDVASAADAAPARDAVAATDGSSGTDGATTTPDASGRDAPSGGDAIGPPGSDVAASADGGGTETPSGCACSAPGRTRVARVPALALAALGLGLASARRRRRRSSVARRGARTS